MINCHYGGNSAAWHGLGCLEVTITGIEQDWLNESNKLKFSLLLNFEEFKSNDTHYHQIVGYSGRHQCYLMGVF